MPIRKPMPKAMPVPSRRITIVYHPQGNPGHKFEYWDTTVVPPQNAWACHAKRKALIRWVASYPFEIEFKDDSPLVNSKLTSVPKGNQHHCWDHVLDDAPPGGYLYNVRIQEDEDDPEILIDDGWAMFKAAAVTACAAAAAGTVAYKLLTCKKELPER